MSKHTEGSWTYEYNNDTGPRDECFYEFYDITAGGKLIGRIETEADARLATAAPDLLKALEKFRQAFVIAIGDKSPFAKCALSEVDAAISRARGDI